MARYDHRKLDNVGKFVVNTMLFALLWAILALPASSFSLLRFEEDSSQVLSEQKYRYGRQPVVENENTTVRLNATTDQIEVETVLTE